MITLILLSLIAQQLHPFVQISVVRDGEGKFIEWQNIEVEWGGIVTTVPDHVVIDNDALQEWFLPVKEKEWQKLSFQRNIPGEYGLRWSRDGELWSEPVAVVVILPKAPIHVQ